MLAAYLCDCGVMHLATTGRHPDQQGRRSRRGCEAGAARNVV